MGVISRYGQLSRGKPIILETEMKDNFKIIPKQLEANISEKTKWFIINSPGNPTGAVYDKSELKEISKVLLKISSCEYFIR